MNEASDTIKDKLLREMADAIAKHDWEASYAVLGLVRAIDPPERRADVLNNLLVMPGHELHQEVTREIQKLRSPSNVPNVRQVPADGFHKLEYKVSGTGLIAKWFSHALAEINPPEANALIREFAGSINTEVAEEMAYRLRRINA